MEKKTDFSPLEAFSIRVKQRRKELNISQDNLARLVWTEIFSDDNMSEKARETKRKCIVGYENGKFPKDPEVYFQLCKALRCDMGYLFGEHDCSTKDIQGVVNYTGLTERAVSALHKRVENDSGYNTFVLGLISDFIEDDAFLLDCANWIKSFLDLPSQKSEGKYLISDINDTPLYYLDLDSMRETILIGLQNSIMRFLQRTYLDNTNGQ